MNFRYAIIEHGQLKIIDQDHRLTLEEMQKIVGGYIELFMIDDENRIDYYCDEEGKLKSDSYPNVKWGEDIIMNAVLICSNNGNGELASLTDEQIVTIMYVPHLRYLKTFYD
jgi:hypothetical protein